MEEVKISIKRKVNYGTEMIYICEPQHAHTISQLTGKRTVSERDLEALKSLGVQIREIDVEIKNLINA